MTGFNFYSARGQLTEVLSYRTLRERAVAVARRLVGLNLKRGDRVAVVAETGPEFMAVFFGCQYAGLVPCPMPYSDVYRRQGCLCRAHCRHAAGRQGARRHRHDRSYAAYRRRRLQRAGVDVVMSYDELREAPPSIAELEPFGPDEAAYIQYSSGSTSEPKGVLITQRAIIANTRGILRDGLKVDAE